jgi:N6-adenosine-specific RNA methylase IME4
MEIKTNPEYEKLLPKLPNEQYEALKNSIKNEGQHYPIAYNSKGEILDGHQRFKSCLELGIQPKLEEQPRNFNDLRDERQFVLETNLIRRHLETWHRIMLFKPLLLIYREKANERIQEQGIRGENSPSLGKILPSDEAQGKAIEKFAEAVHSNPETVRQALWIEEHAPEKIPELEKGESISKVYREIKHDETVRELEKKLPFVKPANGLFDVIVIDPPWKYEMDYDAENFRGIPAYPTLSIEEIKQLKIPANENCILWLWTTNSFLHDAYHILDSWNFEPKTVLTWMKDSIGVGVWLRGQTEHCILAVKGKPKIELHGQSTALFAKKTGHSRKPEEFYQLVDSLCSGSKLDYFAREKREGWEVYGTLEHT